MLLLLLLFVFFFSQEVQGMNVQVMGSAVKVTLPRVTREYRESLAKKAHEVGEEAKVAMRKQRQEAQQGARKKKDEMSKDELFELEESLTNLTKTNEKKVGEVVEKKVKELLKD